MDETASLCTESVIRVLETNFAQFADIARQTKRLPGAPEARDYTDAERDQLTSGIVRMLLEAARKDEPKFRRIFMEHAIPSLVREGETVATIVRWNASYVVLFGSALAAAVPPEHRVGALEWFAGFSGVYLSEVLRAALEASPAKNVSSAA